MAFEPRITIITLGVADLAASTAFYEKLGFTRAAASNEDITFFLTNGTVLALFGRAALAKDAKVADDGSGFPAVTLAHNVASTEEVDQLFAYAVACGATPKKPPQKVSWGGYSGYFADPDGHLWEIAHDPLGLLDENGNMVLQK